MARPLTSAFTKGFDELDRKLIALGQVSKSQKLRDLFWECAEIIRAEVLSNVRRMFKRKTGNLERNIIAARSKGRNAGAWVKAALKAAPHAHLLEFGHRIVGHKPRLTDKGKRAPAYPFFRPAVDTVKGRVLSHIREGVRRLMEAA